LYKTYQYMYRYFGCHNGFEDSTELRLHSNLISLPYLPLHWTQDLGAFSPISLITNRFKNIVLRNQLGMLTNFYLRWFSKKNALYKCIITILIKIILSWKEMQLTELRLFKVNVFVTLFMTAWTVIT
jgi:hypothetical protein